jgi:hypothetical protein
VRFQERQRFRQVWLWVLMVGVLAVSAIPMIARPSAGSFTSLAFTALVVGLLAYAHLDVIVDEEQILVRFRPFHLRGRRIPLEQVAEAYARTYSPINEYGGWGIRLCGDSMAYNAYGNEGVQLVLTDGRRILIGSQKSQELAAALARPGPR